jgi:8-amino-7-oxononanoate synthase
MTYKKQIEELKNQGQYRFLKDIEHLNEKHILYKGQKLLNIASNDYLGISTNKALFNEFASQINQKDYQFSSASSRLLSGNYNIYTKLEKLISEIYNKEESVVFNSGYHANTGILPAITTKQDLIIADKLVHASLIDGFKLSNANFKRFKHKDYKQLENILIKERNNYQNIFIVSESTFSMDGDNADLQKLVNLKKQYNAFLYIDEAHSIGVYGKNGYGLCEELNLIDDIDFIVGTFGKALASVGAFVALNSEFKDIIVNKSRSLIYTTALPPINLQWTYFILNKLPKLSAERDKLILLNKEIIQLFKNNGINIKAERHIVPIITKSNENTIKINNQLLEKGYFVSAIRYPTVPINTARIRLSLNSNLNIDELKNLAFIFKL